MVLRSGKPAKATLQQSIRLRICLCTRWRVTSCVRDRETDLNCLRMAKLVLTSHVTCDDMDRSLSRMRPRLRTSTLGSTESAPMTKGLQSSLSIFRDDEHQMNSDLEEFSCSRLHFIQSAMSLRQFVETDRRCWTSVELGRQKPYTCERCPCSPCFDIIGKMSAV